MQPMMMIGISAATVLILYLGGQTVLQGDLEIGLLSSLLNYVLMVLMSVMMVGMCLLMYTPGKACAQRIFEVIDTTSDIQDGSVPALPEKTGRVMREAEENRSMSPKEKVLSFSNSARRRLAPRPWAAKEACLEAMTPQYMETEATTSISAPIFRMMGRELLAMPLSMISAMSRGRISSQMVSSATRAGARTACFWYPFR